MDPEQVTIDGNDVIQMYVHSFMLIAGTLEALKLIDAHTLVRVIEADTTEDPVLQWLNRRLVAALEDPKRPKIVIEEFDEDAD